MGKKLLDIYLKIHLVTPYESNIDILIKSQWQINSGWHNWDNYYILLNDLLEINDKQGRIAYIKSLLRVVHEKYSRYDFDYLTKKELHVKFYHANKRVFKNEFEIESFRLEKMIYSITPIVFQRIREICLDFEIHFDNIIEELKNQNILFLSDTFLEKIQTLNRSWSGKRLVITKAQENEKIESLVLETASKKYEYLNQIGLFTLSFFKDTEHSQSKKHKILSKILGVNERTAKAMYNKESRYLVSKETISKVKEDLAI